MIAPRKVFDDILRNEAIAAGATPILARIVAATRATDGSVDTLAASDGTTVRGRVVIGADGALSPIAHLTGLLDADAAICQIAIRGYLRAEVPLPLLALMDARPGRIFPGYGWLFPGAAGEANIGIGLALHRGHRPAARLRVDLMRLCARLRASGDLPASAEPGPVTGGWLRMGGVGSRPAARNVLLVGDAAGLVNPLQGEGIAPAIVSGRLAAEAVLARFSHAGEVYTAALEACFGPRMIGTAAVHTQMLRRARFTSASARVLTTPRRPSGRCGNVVALPQRPRGGRPASAVGLERPAGAKDRQPARHDRHLVLDPRSSGRPRPAGCRASRSRWQA